MISRLESKEKRQKRREKREETRDKRQETRDKRQETRDKRQETRGVTTLSLRSLASNVREPTSRERRER
jgi:hypothetical protein